jgi:putative glutamine transport system ATP-binding protein
MIRLNTLCKSFGNLEVLKNICLHVKEGEKVVIIGPSGSGKSTLIRCINGLEEPSGGEQNPQSRFPGLC